MICHYEKEGFRGKEKAIKMWLNGGDFRTIRDEVGESVGKLSTDLSELRKEFPELEELRKINMFLNEHNLSLSRL